MAETGKSPALSKKQPALGCLLQGPIGPNRAQGPLFWGLRPQTPIWSAFGLHMDPFWVHMDPKIHWGPYGPIWEFGFFGPYIGSTWDPTYYGTTWDPTWDQKMRQYLGPGYEAAPGTRV